MTSYFWSGFPSLSGRPRVMYGRRHIGGGHPPTTPPLSALGLLHYRLSYRANVVLHPVSLMLFVRVFDILRDRLDYNVLLVIMYASFIDSNMMSYGSLKWGIWVGSRVRRMMIDFENYIRSLINSSLGTKTYPDMLYKDFLKKF